MKRTPVCEVKILGWDDPYPTSFRITCLRCDRVLGSFSQHESAMAWAQAHAVSNKHIR